MPAAFSLSLSTLQHVSDRERCAMTFGRSDAYALVSDSGETRAPTRRLCGTHSRYDDTVWKTDAGTPRRLKQNRIYAIEQRGDFTRTARLRVHKLKVYMCNLFRLWEFNG